MQPVIVSTTARGGSVFVAELDAAVGLALRAVLMIGSVDFRGVPTDLGQRSHPCQAVLAA
jgi:hypothetical protein